MGCFCHDREKYGHYVNMVFICEIPPDNIFKLKQILFMKPVLVGGA